MKNCVRW